MENLSSVQSGMREIDISCTRCRVTVRTVPASYRDKSAKKQSKCRPTETYLEGKQRGIAAENVSITGPHACFFDDKQKKCSANNQSHGTISGRPQASKRTETVML